MTAEQAGAYYLDWICWANAITDTFYDLTANRSYDSLTAKKYRAAASRAARQLRTIAGALDSPSQAWPDNVSEAAGKVSTSLLRQVTALNSWARATSASDVMSASAALSDSGGYTAAQTIRLRLDLPAAGAKNDGCRDRGGDPRSAEDITSTSS